MFIFDINDLLDRYHTCVFSEQTFSVSIDDNWSLQRFMIMSKFFLPCLIHFCVAVIMIPTYMLMWLQFVLLWIVDTIHTILIIVIIWHNSESWQVFHSKVMPFFTVCDHYQNYLLFRLWVKLWNACWSWLF